MKTYEDEEIYLMPESERDLEYVKNHGYKQMTGVNYCWWEKTIKENISA